MKDGMKDGKKDGMFHDNRKVKDEHREGIERVKQRKGEHEKVDGHHGKMGKHHKGSDGFKVPDNDKSPRRA